MTGSILYSRIGYDLGAPIKIVVRGEAGLLGAKAVFRVRNLKGESILEGGPVYWGPKWGSHWWILDLSAIQTKGACICAVDDNENGVALQTERFEIEENLLWDRTWDIVALDQLDARIELRNKNIQKLGAAYAEGGGWQDCGSYLREANSHATMIIGLLDLLELAPDRIPADAREEILTQILVGTDYLAFCQDKARELGRGEGGIIHEWPKHCNVITGDTAKGALCFARVARLLRPERPEKADIYAERAERSFGWLDREGPVEHPGGEDIWGNVQPNDGFEPRAHGAPEGFTAYSGWMACDLVTMIWIALELFKDGKPEYRDRAVHYAQLLLERQIPKEQAEGGYHGHFRTFASADFSEKAWVHHHMGYDAGSTFPHYLIPLFEMIRLWPGHASAEQWRRCLQDFAYGYFLPACADNPFHLLPMGWFRGEGLLLFSGLWHGINGAYGSAAALALELGEFTGDPRFADIATGNLQWIAGLNCGIPEEDGFTPSSMIYGIGDRFAGSWTKIPGAICNGFSASKQFVFDRPLMATDLPEYFTDEDWITHTGGWLSAISRLVKTAP